MKIKVNCGGLLSTSGEHEVTLTGGYERCDNPNTYWFWRIQERVNLIINFRILLTGVQHEEMLKTYWQWRKDNNISWNEQTQKLYGKYTK